MCRIQFSVMTFTQSSCLSMHCPGCDRYFQILAQFLLFFFPLLVALIKSCWKQYRISSYIAVRTFQLMSLKILQLEQMNVNKTVPGHLNVQKINTNRRKLKTSQHQINFQVCMNLFLLKQVVFSRDQLINLENFHNSIYTDQSQVTHWVLQKYIKALTVAIFN